MVLNWRQPAPGDELPAESATGNPLLVNIGRVALFFAAVVAVYLLVVALSQGQVAGCEEGKSCHTVLSSKWAKLFGVPIGALGAASYLALLGLSFTRSFGAARLFLAISVIGGALWFTGVQAFALKTFCPWCCTTHALAVIGTVLLAIGLPRVPGAKKSTNLLPTAAALAALVITAFAQIKSSDPQPVAVTTATDVATVEVSKERRKTLSLHDKFELSTVELPAIGNAENSGACCGGDI